MSDRNDTGLSHEERCALLDAELGRLVEATRGGDPSAPVPSCPGWTLAKLMRHLGIVHRWARHMVAERVETPLWTRDVTVALPSDPGDYPGWLAEGGADLVAALREAGPGAPMWAWGTEQGSGFWSRRMLHETTVHRADVELALGREPYVEPATAANGVEELLANLLVAEWTAGPLSELGGSGETIHMHATGQDGDVFPGEWTITLLPGTFTWTRGHAKGDVAVRGPVGDLLLLLYGRRTPGDGRLEVLGDRDLLGRWLDKTAF
ncbi:hypothetical protein Pth03_55320 [Planotetraspora thailandica]|uniref:Maleylpyruvate isomerase family mycothiol-dependent enzyme n=1 Tax=Planotetraspora thailandica TaxID=487172 RepID=A0A8J3V5M7_9ACTN|nr:maleylpyruvate isomerase family mycothiol-dependent enzyme [Planotetraspora thailandica]GII57143.1 hypothetical protein Pth03_55320 [Planotetraspora thailandica]